MPLFLQPLQRVFDFSGRSSRSEFWSYMLFFVILMALLALLGVAVGMPMLVQWLSLLFIVPNLALAVRRFHDINWSGWWVLLSFVPFLGVLVLVAYLWPSRDEGNRFGPAMQYA